MSFFLKLVLRMSLKVKDNLCQKQSLGEGRGVSCSPQAQPLPQPVPCQLVL